MNNIYIFKGDSTTFADVTKFLTFHIQTLLDLKGWKAQFILGSITKEVDNIESKSFEIVLTNAETSNLLYGQKNGIVKLFDEKGQVKTVTNTIPFEIGNKVSDNKHELINLTIPQTTEIEMVLEIGQQGEGGTSNYNDLFNKPKINGISLQGEKSLDDLEIQAKGNYATSEALQVVSEKQTSTDDEVNHLTGEISDVKLKLPKKLEAVNILQGSNITLDKQGNNITINAQTGQSGTSDYTELINKPQINSIELTGNKTLEQLGIQPKGDYLTSIPSEYVTETELAQKGYATTSQLEDIKTTKADTNLENITSNIDFVVETKSNSDGSWYRKYKNGWLEQGGTIKMGVSGEVKTVTLLKPYANSNYTAIYQKTSAYAPSNGANEALNAKTPTSFGVTCGEYQQLAMWYANGQGA